MLFSGCEYLRELLLVMKRRGILCCAFLLLFLSLLAISTDNGFVNSGSVLVTEPTTRVLSYTPSDPILIQSDADFETQGWPGDGSLGMPYIIEGLEINVEHLSLRIIDTSVYFVVQNCQFIASIEATSATAVSFENTSNGIIQECNMTGNIGMHLEDSSNITISANIFHSFEPQRFLSYGLRIWGSANCSLNNNVFIGDGIGLDFHMSDNCSVENNGFEGCGLNIFEVRNPKTPSGHGLTFTNNLVNDRFLGVFEGVSDATLNGSLYGQLWLFDCNNLFILGGEFIEATQGIVFSGCINCSIVGSNVSDCVKTGIKFQESRQCSIVECSIERNGKMWNPGDYESGGIFIEDKTIIYSECAILDSRISFNYGHALYLKGISWCTVNSTYFESNGGKSFLLQSCSNCEISDNVFIKDGIFIEGMKIYVSLNSSLHSIVNNTVNGKPLGYFVNMFDSSITGSDYGSIILLNSSRVHIYDGEMTDCFFGIQMIYCSDCEVRNTTITGFSGYAIRIKLSEFCEIKKCYIKGDFSTGIRLSGSNSCSIENSIVHGGVHGVELGSSGCSIIGNTLAYNGATNLYVHVSTSNNLIYGNKFADPGDVSVYDYGTDNQFDDGSSIGNSWSDYDGVGIFEIPGSAGSADHYPSILTATSPASINSLDDLIIEEGSTGYSLNWNIDALYNTSLAIFKNGTKVSESNDSMSSMNVQLEDLQVGIYNYTIVVTDMLDSVSSDTVLVTIIERSEISNMTDTFPTTTIHEEFDASLIIYLCIGGIGVLVIIIILMKKKYSGSEQN